MSWKALNYQRVILFDIKSAMYAIRQRARLSAYVVYMIEFESREFIRRQSITLYYAGKKNINLL